MKVVLFITPDEVRKRTSLDSNVDDDKIINSMRLAQDLTLEPLLGSVMLDEIKAQVIAGTLTTAYSNLLDYYCRPVLIQAILNKISLFLVYRYNNTGVVKNNLDNEEILSTKDIVALRNEVQESVNEYGQRLTSFLEANTELYPLYDDIVEGKVTASKIGNVILYTGE
jgi:hypothetical protein